MKKYAGSVFYLGLIFLCGLFVITRFFRLDTIPTGLHLDEAGMAYDAWCLAKYGVDRYLNPWPLYLTNYGGGQSVLYAYLCAGLFRLFGYSIWLVRLPIIFSTFLAMLFGVKIAKKIYPENDYLPLLAGLLIVVCPYFILNGRFGLDCNLMLGLSTVFLYFFMDAVSEGSRFACVLAGIAGGLTLYTYALSYVILPVFLLLGLLYCLWVKRFSFKSWLLMALPMGILALPLIIVQLINIFDWPELHFAGFTFTKLEVYRVGEIGSFRPGNLWDFLRCTFVGEEFNYTSVPGFCMLYGITIVLFVIGLVSVIRRTCRSLRTREADRFCYILLWFLTVTGLFSLMATNIYRISPIYLVVVLIAAEGIHIICGMGKRNVPAVVCLSFAFAYLLCFLRFGIYYYMGDYTRENYPLDHFGIVVPEAVAYLEEHPECANQGTYMAQTDVYFALSCLASPYELELDPHIQGHQQYGYYHCGTLPEIDPNCNYIVQDIFVEYAQTLRSMGYTEIQYPNYSLFLSTQG